MRQLVSGALAALWMVVLVMGLSACGGGGSDSVSEGGGSGGTPAPSPSPVPSPPPATAPGPLARLEISPAGGLFTDTTERRKLALRGFDATMEEAGLPDYEIVSWYGVIAPAQTPPAVIERLNAAVVQVMSDPAVSEQIIASGAKPATSTPGQLADLIKSDVVRFNQIAKAASVQPE